MSAKQKKQKETISEKISAEFVPHRLQDPEVNSDDELKLAEFDEALDGEAGPSSGQQFSEFRKKNLKLLSDQSQKYKGRLSSRRELSRDSDSSEEQNDKSAESSAGDSDLETYRKQLKKCQISNDEDKDESFSTDDEIDQDASGSDDEMESSSQDSDSDYGSTGEEPEENQEEKNLISIANGEIQKGLAVQNQLKIWEKLLEVRIHSQKVLQKANSLPQPEKFVKISTECSEFRDLAKESSKNVENLLEKMLEMQNILTKQFEETKDLLKETKRKRPESETSSEPAAKRFAGQLHETHEKFQPYRDSVLQKWHDRTKILTPGAMGKKSASTDFDILKKIETAMLNKSALVKKSQTVKGNYQIFGEEAVETKSDDGDKDEMSVRVSNQLFCPNIYDDTDFYHQQLRELIEHKSNISANPEEITKQLVELQKLRHKMKKTVDTRASKGRKIRYVVHNKLVNFMAPQENSEWTDESKNELFRSLFSSS